MANQTNQATGGRFDIPADTKRLLESQAAGNQPDTLFATFDAICQERVGHKLFTLLSWSIETEVVQRVYSSRPVEYPAGKRKPMGPTAWGTVVLREGKNWIGRTAEDMRWAFPDHELIASLSCENCINAPVRFNGEVLGAISFLDAAGSYSDADLAEAATLAQLLAPAFLHLRILEQK